MRTNNISLDPFYIKILRELQRDANQSNQELAEKHEKLQLLCDKLIENEIRHIDTVMVLENKIASLNKKLLKYKYINAYSEKYLQEPIYFISDCSGNDIGDDNSLISSLTENN